MTAGLPGKAGRSARGSKALLIGTAVASVLALSGCGEDSSIVTNDSSSGNSAPTISGAPLSSVMSGTQYAFSPTADDADGDSLTFSISGCPGWATFDTGTGRLVGTPSSSDVGVYSNITITVSDGASTVALKSFSVDVVATATGSVTLSWNPPTENTDGTALTDLAGYKIYWGTSAGNYPNSVVLDNPGLTSYVVEQLTPATWYFVTTAVNGQGVESSFSNVASKTIM